MHVLRVFLVAVLIHMKAVVVGAVACLIMAVCGGTVVWILVTTAAAGPRVRMGVAAERGSAVVSRRKIRQTTPIIMRRLRRMMLSLGLRVVKWRGISAAVGVSGCVAGSEDELRECRDKNSQSFHGRVHQ